MAKSYIYYVCLYLSSVLLLLFLTQKQILLNKTKNGSDQGTWFGYEILYFLYTVHSLISYTLLYRYYKEAQWCVQHTVSTCPADKKDPFIRTLESMNLIISQNCQNDSVVIEKPEEQPEGKSKLNILNIESQGTTFLTSIKMFWKDT